MTMAEYKLLVTGEKVVGMAFPPHTGVTAVSVTDETILTAQEKFIKPVLNGLYGPLLDGEYPELASGYIKAPLAQYVRMLMLPQLAYSVGIAGISSVKNANLEPCDGKALRLLCRMARANGLTLIKRAVDHIEENADLYPEYDPDENVLNRVDISSQFVL